MDNFGQIAYDAYSEKADGLSLITRDALPSWEHLSTDIQDAWTAAAKAVVKAVVGDGG